MNTFNLPQEYVDYSIRLLAAAGFAAVIGIEREFHGRAAGFRTNVLVGTGAALFMILSQVIVAHGNYGGTDPARIAAQIVTGIGFLGAGAIIKSGLSVKGLTTAACMWIVASIGMACGMKEFYLAAFVTCITLICLFVLQFLGKLIPSHFYRTLIIKTVADDSSGKIVDIVKLFAKVKSSDFDYDFNSDELVIKLNVRILCKGNTDNTFNSIKKSLLENIENIKSIRWSKS